MVKEKSKSVRIGTVVLVSLIVAVIVSLATATITGNVIKLNNNPLGAYKVYTKSEVDTIASNLRNSINGPEAFVIELTGEKPGENFYVKGVRKSVLLISATDSSVTIRIGSITKEISEGNAAVFDSVEVYLISSDETNLTLKALFRIRGVVAV